MRRMEAFTVRMGFLMLSVSFRRLAWSNLLAQSAEQLSLAAVPIVAVLMLHAGPGEIGFLAFQKLRTPTLGKHFLIFL